MDNVDPSVLVDIVQKFSPYINCLCKKYYISGGTNDDLYEEGVIGILQACKNFQGNSLLDRKFESFAKICIKRQMFDAIKNSNTNKNKILNESISFSKIIENGDENTLLNSSMGRNISNDPLEIFLDKEKIQEKLIICKNELNDFEIDVLNHFLTGEKQSEIAKNLDKDIKYIDNTLQRIKNKLNKY